MTPFGGAPRAPGRDRDRFAAAPPAWRVTHGGTARVKHTARSSTASTDTGTAGRAVAGTAAWAESSPARCGLLPGPIGIL
ncbi:hypothetical protein GCM10019016_099270 [Streptomyces prasinosporus]|uniref:Uncharacterized protein n=1 Tax=Streptomyces prasinosporus TaxID=68256 RepID=A0ABP6U533_9ACTN